MIDNEFYRGAAINLPPELTKLQQDSECVRAHLVSIRGGAMFLSPADAERLHGWLTDGVTPQEIILAIERAAEKRAQQLSKLPLTLAQAKRHLGKPTQSFALDTKNITAHPMSGIAQMLQKKAQSDKDRKTIDTLRTQLLALNKHEKDLVRQAMLLVSHFFIHRWAQLSLPERTALEEQAAHALGDLRALLTPKQLHNAIEERTRAMLREDFPYLSAATILAQVKE